eukprot:TRINITY_DN12386_c0_g2_i1.p5 TRINITY_DN12386_c0_g2~~TRINITY_DN12386_c0_g2_i1.p5  ORF type:complete len:114 (+),score=4.59 TRINITY_DN12386_c0_g2_i1:47-388(+)
MADCSSDEGEECPLCVEPLVLDDLQFFPCSCGYQICRFCWHRIRTEENGLCPACRQPYQDKPAEFNPVSQDEYLKSARKSRKLDRKSLNRENSCSPFVLCKRTLCMLLAFHPG